MPSFPIVDAHLHIWDPDRIGMGWQAPGAPLNRPYTIGDYQEQTGGIDIEAMVFVECFVDPGQSLKEVALAEEAAAADPRLKSIVAQAPLEWGDDARPYLDHLASRHPRVKGIRRMIEFQPDPDFARRPAFQAGVRALRDYGMSFDVNVHHTLMDQAVDLSRAVEGVPLILDHGGKPGIRDGAFQPWRAQIAEYAGNPDSWCKLSDFPVEAHWDRWTEDDLRRWIDAVVEVFGFARLIFAFDWPVCLQAVTPQRWVDLLDRHFAGVPEADLRRFYAGNAKTVYQIS